MEANSSRAAFDRCSSRERLAEPGNLVAAEHRGEGAGDDDDHPRLAAQRQGGDQGDAAGGRADRDQVRAGAGVEGDQLPGGGRVHVAGGEQLPAGSEEQATVGADQPERPVQGAVGEVLGVALEEELGGGPAQRRLLAVAPQPAQPSRRGEARVQQRHDGGTQDRERQLVALVQRETGADDDTDSQGRDQQQHDGPVAGAQRPQPGALQQRPAAGGEPEPRRRLDHAAAPEQHHPPHQRPLRHRGRGRQTAGQAHRIGAGGHRHQGGEERGEGHPGGAHHAVPEERERVSRGEEGGDGEVGEPQRPVSGDRLHAPDHAEHAQQTDGNGEQGSLRRPLPHPRGDGDRGDEHVAGGADPGDEVDGPGHRATPASTRQRAMASSAGSGQPTW
jgi:hypothetical protein